MKTSLQTSLLGRKVQITTNTMKIARPSLHCYAGKQATIRTVRQETGCDCLTYTLEFEDGTLADFYQSHDTFTMVPV